MPKNNPTKSSKIELPLVPLRELVIFPNMVLPFFVGRPGSIKAIEEAMAKDRMVFITTQTVDVDDPAPKDLHMRGTVSKILQMLKLPDGTLRILAEGQERAQIKKVSEKKEMMRAKIQLIPEIREISPDQKLLMASVRDAFQRHAKLKRKIPSEVQESIYKAEYPDKLVNLICGNTSLSLEAKLELLEQDNATERMERLAVFLTEENEKLSLQKKIQTQVKKRLEKNQKEYFLNEQIRQINKELGKDDGDMTGAKSLRDQLEALQLPDEVADKAFRELDRLEKQQPMSPEAGVLRTYLEWVCDLPWSDVSEDNRDISRAAEILDEDHYNMKKPKERILDFIAVRQLAETARGPILCLAGPPGTGKTSLGRSVARSLNREFVRISLGGVRDEAEIRGHRKTYVGALPGKILQAMKRAKTVNPVFLLDEIDKMASDFRGDPASALLEVLDPEQNNTFVDHYLEVSYDLSKVMFITTANSLSTIPHALRDRMEIIEIPGYTDLEKVKIASDFIIPKQIKENGLDWAQIKFQPKALKAIIGGYTMESGVRSLERKIAGVIRKIAREAVSQELLTKEARDEADFQVTVTEKGIKKYLGPRMFQRDLVSRNNRPGLVNGLAWTESGGTLLPIEVALMPGTGKLELTGSLGDVMKESAKTAYSLLRSESEKLGIGIPFHEKNDIHIHVPEGAIPKDGPSAGITMTCALLSALKQTPLIEDLAMTGEITLTGRILPIGGVKEKVLAAFRNQLKVVFLPEANRKDTEELPKEVTGALEFRFADNVYDAWPLLFPEGTVPGADAGTK